MIEPILQSQLEPIAQRHRLSRFWREAAIGWAALTPVLVAGLLLFTGDSLTLFVACFAAAAFVLYEVARRRSAAWNPDHREIARRVEHQHPDLHALLITAVEQQPQEGALNFLQERVVRDASAEIRKLPWLDLATVRQLRQWKGAALALLVVWAFTLLFFRSPQADPATLHAQKQQKLSVTPGDVSLEKGSSLVVLARFEGPLPKEAVMVIRAPLGTNEVRILLTKNLGDPVFGGSIPEVLTNFTYRIDYDTARSEEYKVRTFEHPRLEHADAKIDYPEYTKLTSKSIPETKRISAVEGSKVDFTFKLNKPVVSARLIGKDKSVVPLAVDTNQPLAMLKQYTLLTNGTYNLELIDDAGRTNKIPAQFAFDALKNRPPELKVITPKGDKRVSPLEEVAFQGEAWDDFGLGSYGLTYSIGGAEPKSIVLGTATSAGQKTNFQQLLSMEALSAQPDQLVSWHLWAEDTGPDGKPRRTASDMYFVEVRPFEEIYRQGNTMEGQASEQQQQQQQGGAGNEALKLAELQKQIINATWKIQRRETAPKPSEAYGKDVPVVLESQQKALDQTEALAERATSPKSKEIVEAVQKAMEKAVTHLNEATNSTAPLPAALASEQAAYQALLKLAGREYMVTQNRSQSSSSSSQANQRNQEQLSQLDLKKEENRYETQRQAANPQQSQEQKEQLAMLNRLKELAQRQQDLNERMKELQNSLQEAKTDAEREEIRRRLKRLREEEQEMLADIDDLQNKMQQPQNQSQTAEAQKQLEQTRGEVQKTSEALQKESASQALASGTRAQRNLQQMRDELRKKSSTQFSEEMRQMRSEARDLAQKQEDISKEMEANQEQDKKSLRGSTESELLAQKLEEQKHTLTNLLENMRAVSEKSETSEPLLSKQLYDTFRKTSQENVEEKLNVSGELLKRSMPREARQVERLAGQHIEELRKGVEKAAESVLGDDVEALRLAKNELDALSKDLEKELAQANAGTNGNQGASSRQGQEQRNAQAGQNGQPQGQQGDPSAQQNQNGEQALAQAGGNPPGQQQNTNSQNGAQGQRPSDQKGQQGSGQSPQQGEQQNQQGQGQGQQQAKNGEQPGEGQQQANAQQGGKPGEPQNQAGQQPGNQPGEQQGQQPGQSQQKGNQPGQEGQAQQSQQQGQKGQQGKQGQGQQGQQGEGQGQGQGQGQQAANQPGQQQPPNPQGRQGQPNQQQNQKGQPGQAQGQGNQPNQQPGEQQAQTDQNRNTPASNAQTARNKRFQLDNTIRDGSPEGSGPQGPITGENYVEWSERLGNVEEMVDLPELRTQIARVRERARVARGNFKKMGEKPKWAEVHTQMAGPLNEVRDRIAEELARRESKDALVPIDRDPVPARYSELVKKYYEKLGSDK